MSQLDADQRDFRMEAIRFMLRSDPEKSLRVAARHPEWRRLGADLPVPDTLSELMWDELEELEWERMRIEPRATGSRRSPILFYVRRRVLARYADLRDGRRLPELWRRVRVLPRERLVEISVQIGVRVMSGIVVALDRHDRRDFLAKLNDRQQAEVRRSIRRGEASPQPRGLVDAWRAGYAAARSLRGADRADEMLGRLVLARLFQELSPEDRKRTAKGSRTTFPDLLSRSDVLALDAGHLAAMLAVVGSVLGLDLGEDLPPIASR